MAYAGYYVFAFDNSNLYFKNYSWLWTLDFYPARAGLPQDTVDFPLLWTSPDFFLGDLQSM